jgi:hypothetical protein
MDASLDRSTRQDDEDEDEGRRTGTYGYGEEVPGVQENSTIIEHVSSQDCARKALPVIEEECCELGHDEHMQIFNKQAPVLQ